MDNQKILNALKNADAAGDTAAATKLAAILKQQMANDNGGTIGQGGDDYHAAAGAAVLRGMADIPALPANIAQLGAMGVEYLRGQELGSSGASKFLDELPDTRDMLASVPMVGPASQYKIDSTLGDYVSTAGEFAGSAAGGSGIVQAGKKALGYAPKAMNVVRDFATGTASGLGSEAAGQALKGTEYENAARIIGGIASPLAAGKLASKTSTYMMNRSIKNPTVESLRSAKNAAYKDVDNAGEVFSPQVTSDIALRARAAAVANDFVDDVDKQTKAALAILEGKAGSELTIGQLDKIRQGLFKRYSSAPNEAAIPDMIDIIDEAIDSSTMGGELMQTARLANKRYKKAELLDTAFRNADLDTAGSGSGGNTVNKYRQAVTSILKNKKKVRFFDAEEVAAMEQFVKGSMSENTMRQIGKLSPSGNGLMTALQTGGAVASSGATLPFAIGGELAARNATGRAIRGKENLETLITGGPQRLMPDPLLGMENINRAAKGSGVGLLSQSLTDDEERR